MRKKPFMAAEFFDLLTKRLKEAGKMPNIIDYALPKDSSFDQAATYQLKNEEFATVASIMYGSNEGIYLSISIFNKDGNMDIGTVKCLPTDEESFHKMGILGTDYVAEADRYVNGNLDEFDFEGYTIFVDDKPRITTCSLERARERAEKMGGKIRNNETRKFLTS